MKRIRVGHVVECRMPPLLAAEVAVAVGGEVVRLVELRILVQGGPNSPVPPTDDEA